MSEKILDKSVLIFEDDLDLARQWSKKLKENGIKTVHVWTVDAAVASCNQQEFDAIVCDVFLQDANGKQIPKAGITLLNYLRVSPLGKIPKWAETVPIIAITGSPKINGFDALDTAKSLGGTVAMRKPFAPEEIVDNILRLIKVSD